MTSIGDLTLSELGLSTRSVNALISNDINSVEKLIQMCACRLMDTPNVGVQTTLEVIDALKDQELSLSECNRYQ